MRGYLQIPVTLSKDPLFPPSHHLCNISHCIHSLALEGAGRNRPKRTEHETYHNAIRAILAGKLHDRRGKTFRIRRKTIHVSSLFAHLENEKCL